MSASPPVDMAAPAIPLDDMPLGVRVGGKRVAQSGPLPGAKPRPARRPLTRFTQPEEAPNFYLSLSDLMSLLLVFFVLIFALTSPGSPAPSKPAAATVRAVIAPPVKPVAHEDPWPAPAPVPDDLRRGLAAVRGQGSPDPGLTSRAPKPAPKPEAGIVVKPQLLTLVASATPSSRHILPGGQRSLAAMLAEVQRDMARDRLEMERKADRLVLRLPEAITFDLGRAEIKPAMDHTLARLAKTLKDNTGLMIVVTGHTDDLPISTEYFASNWELSGARAAAVARALMEHGLPAELFTIQGLADTRPVAPNDSPVNRQSNRRVEIELRKKG